MVADPVLIEGDSGTREALFEVRLSRPAETAFSVNFATRDGSATSGIDYTAASGVLNFVPGQDVAFVRVLVLCERAAEASESFDLVVTAPASPSVGTTSLVGTATILDDDSSAGPVLSLAGGTVVESFNSALRFVLTLSKPSIDAITVNYRTLGGTAFDDDLSNAIPSSSNNGTVTFAPGQTTASVFIRPDSDSVDERDENIGLELVNPVGASFAGGVAALRATGVILDDDGTGPNLAVFVSNPIFVEGDSGSREALFEVRLSQPAASSFSLTYDTRDGTAVAGQDYSARTGVLTFAPGQDTAFVRVVVAGDRAAEAAETFYLVVTPPASPSISSQGAVGTATILDDDITLGALPVLTISSEPALEGGGSIRFDLTLSRPSPLPVSVTFNTLLGTALDADLNSPANAQANNGVVVIPAGQTSTSVTISLNRDTLDERDETIIGRLSNPVNATLSGGVSQLSAVGIIRDDDGTGSNLSLIVQNQTVMETGLAASPTRLLVQLSPPI